MNISNKGINLIKEFEHFMPKAYLCPGGVWTIGYGHTDGIEPWMSISVNAAEELLKKDIAIFEDIVNYSVDNYIKINQNQFDALVSLAYNIGGTAFKNSTLLRKINQNKIIAAAIHFLDWIKVNGISSEGLTRRRIAEKTLFLS